MEREKLTALRHILQRLEEEYKNYLAHGETNTQVIETEIEAVKEAISVLSAEPCENAVSKGAVNHIIDGLNLKCAYDMPSFWCNKGKKNEDFKVIPTKWHKGYQQALSDVEKALNELPPVQPEEKVGEWVYDAEIDKTTGHCTKCGHYARYGAKTKWCPDCGAKMKGEKEC